MRRTRRRVVSSAVAIKTWLKGDAHDLNTLTELFPSGDTRVVKEGDSYYLAAAEVDNRPAGVPFYEVAPMVLQRVNGAARMLRDSFQPVKLTGQFGDGDRLHAVVWPKSVEARAAVGQPTIAVNGVVQPVPAPRGPGYVALAALSPGVREVLDLMGRAGKDPSWLDLYKVFEIIREDIRPDRIEGRGWATTADSSAFTASANRPDVSGIGARHARLAGSPPKRTMTIDEGRRFIFRLATTWMDSL